MESPSPSFPDLAPDDRPDDRPVWPAIAKGLRLTCPSCGKGPLLHAYLKVRDTCPSCGEALHHQRADDGPAYLTILIAGHLLAPLIMVIYTTWAPEPWVMVAILSAIFVSFSLFLLPRMKGLMVAIQWSRRMHGFGAPVGVDADDDAGR